LTDGADQAGTLRDPVLQDSPALFSYHDESVAWQPSSCSDFIWREIDGEWLVYHVGRYQFHLLDPVTALVFDTLEQLGAADAVQLHRHLTEPDEPELNRIDRRSVRLALEQLRQAELVETCVP
jgi:hypothetical protein